MHMPMKY